jgi:very-short-patch-repair endonuclease
MVKCTDCEREFKTLQGKNSHWGLKHGPKSNKIFTEEHKRKLREARRKNSSWNKGLTKETDPRIEKASISFKKTIKEKGSWWIGRKQSEETKKQISKSRTAFLVEHPDQVPYLLNHSSKMSYPEKVFMNALKENGITGWIYNFQNSIYSYDFAFTELKIDVEIDGSTHNTEKVKKIDERRDKFSEQEGWKVIRFSAKRVKENVTSCIKELNEYLLRV